MTPQKIFGLLAIIFAVISLVFLLKALYHINKTLKN